MSRIIYKNIKIASIIIFSFFLVNVAMAEMPNLKVIPRAGWGADEVLRYKNNEQVWPEEYADIEKIIIHHTAGSTGGDAPGDSVQAVYKWHARNLGWGDVGYNFLVDQTGAVYEGRYGGDGVIGGHAYDSSREIGWNRGTIGISILGTYGAWVDEVKQGYYLEHPTYYPQGRVRNERLKDGKWQIYLDDQLSPEAEDSLTSLIAAKSLEFDIAPTGVSVFQGKSLPNVIGHRDVGSTNCPGDSLYNKLSEIRQISQEKYDQAIAGGLAQKATLIGNGNIEVSLKKDETREIVLQFRNDGDLSWHNYTDDKVILADAGVKNKLVALNGLRMAIETNGHESVNELSLITNTSYQLVEPNVKHGEIGTFKITLAYSKDKLVDKKDLVLAMQDKGWFAGTDVSLTSTAIDLSYKGELLSQNLPVAIFENAKGEAVVKFKNTGTKAWYKKDGDAQVGSVAYLKILDKATGGKNKFYDKSWNGELGLIKQEETEVNPGNFATFKFKYNIAEPGFFRTQFVLMRKAVEVENSPDVEVAGCNADTLTRVDAPIQAELIEANVPSAMLNIWTSKAQFKIKNTGLVPWDSNLVLKVHNPDGSASEFKDVSWGKNGAASHPPTKIMPGQMAILTAKLKAPKEGGVYHPTFSLEYKGKTVFISHNKQLIYTTRVDVAK